MNAFQPSMCAGILRVSRQTLLRLLLLMLSIGFVGSACAQARVEVLGTFPKDHNVVLPQNQLFYVHLHYVTDHPVGIWVDAYYHGKQVNAASSPSLTYNGRGDALVWIELFNANTHVDELRISAGNGSLSTPVVATVPVQIVGGDTSVTAVTEPDWVSRLMAHRAAAQNAAYERQMNAPVSTGDLIFFDLFVLAALGIGIGGLAWPAWAAWRWQGRWRVAAAVPTALVGFTILRILVATTTLDPSSHNLWPFEVLRVGALSVVIMVILLIARKFTRASCPT